jgi:hypothetical protein
MSRFEQKNVNVSLRLDFLKLHLMTATMLFVVGVSEFDFTRCLLGAFAILRKATVSFVTSVCPSVRVQQLLSYWTDFYEILCLGVFENLSKIQVPLKSGAGTLHENECTFMIISR